MILLHLKLGELQVRVRFGAVTGSAVSVVLGTTFIDGFVTGICPPERNTVLLQSETVDVMQKFLTTRGIMTIHDQKDRADPISDIADNDESQRGEGKWEPFVLVRVANK